MQFNDLYNLITENDAHRSYSCLMLDCSNLNEQLLDFQKTIDADDIWEDRPGFGLEKGFHITILYGIHSNIPGYVYSQVGLFPIKYTLGKVSLFENDEYDVLKIDIRSSDLHKLNASCKEELDHTSTYPTYIPHLTIGYLKKGTGKKYTKRPHGITGVQESNRFIFSDQFSQKVVWTIQE